MPSKALAANVALERGLAGVHAHVLFQLVGRVKALLAEITGVGARLKVTLAMLTHMASLEEALAALQTLERFRLDMAGHVGNQLVRLLEGTVAHITEHLALHVVDEHLKVPV